MKKRRYIIALVFFIAPFIFYFINGLFYSRGLLDGLIFLPFLLVSVIFVILAMMAPSGVAHGKIESQKPTRINTAINPVYLLVIGFVIFSAVYFSSYLMLDLSGARLILYIGGAIIFLYGLIGLFKKK